MTPNELKIKYQKLLRVAKDKTRLCMYPECNQKAIKSHVLQKNGILREISVQNHLFQFENTSVFQIEKKGIFELKSIGVNDAFTFPGFCKNHDSEVFKPIENDKFIDLNSTESIRLFSYRSICQEIRRKEIVLDMVQSMINTDYNLNIIVLLYSFKKGLENGIKNLTFFKEELEKDNNRDSSKFVFEIQEINKIDLCISGPINIDDDQNELSKINNTYGSKIHQPFTTSIINLFPYKDKSYLLVAQHKDYPCRWSNLLLKNMRESEDANILKIISDLIAIRFEFWCISPILKERVDHKINELFFTWENNISEFNFDASTDFNLFE